MSMFASRGATKDDQVKRQTLTIFAFIVLLGTKGFAGSITGKVINAETRNPIKGATVMLLETNTAVARASVVLVPL